MNFAKLLRTAFLQSTSGGVGVCLLRNLRLRVHKKVFEWLAVNEFLSNSMEFFRANSRNYLRYLHFLFLHFLYVFFSTNKDFEHLSMKKDPFNQIVMKRQPEGVFVDLLEKYLGMNAGL